jgi:hypothetical protein
MTRMMFAGLVIAGCASAGAPSQEVVPDGPSSRPDASDRVDGPTRQIDAPEGACAMATSGMLASWSFTGEPGSQASTAAGTMATGLVATAVTRSSALSANTGTNSINASNWAMTSQQDATKYFAFSITPPSGCGLDITSIAIDAKSSATGPAAATLATSVDSFAQGQTVSTSAPGTITVAVSGATDAVEIRVYGYSATSTAGTMRLQNTLSITGALH